MYVAPSLLSADFGRLNDEIAAVCEAGADLLGPDKIIGWSTHGPEQLQEANRLTDILDYVGCGPVFASPVQFYP